MTFTRNVRGTDENTGLDNVAALESDAHSEKERVVIQVGVIQDLSSCLQKQAIYCYGEQLKEDVNETSRACGLRIWTRTGTNIWCKLEKSSRRAAAAAWNRVEKRVDMRCQKQNSVQSFSLLLPMDGYPLRLA